MSLVTAFAGSVPKNYETYLGPLFFEPYAIDIVQRIERIKNLRNVLEIAAGTGRVTKHLASNLHPDASLIATDLNEDMLKIAEKIISSRTIHWQVVNAHNLPYEDNSFDLVVCQYGVMFFHHKIKALKEIRRVLMPGGIFLFNTWNELRYNKLSQMAQTILEEIYPDDPPAFLQKWPYSFYNKKEIEEVLCDAGFTNFSIEAVSKIGYASSVEDVVNGIIEGTPNYAYITERNISASYVKEKLKALLTHYYGDKNLQLPMQAYVIKAKKD